MDFDFSDEQKLLKDQARRLLLDAGGVRLARKAVDEAGDEAGGELWREIAAQGWTAAGIAEAQGGLGLTSMETCVLAEEIGRVLAPIPFASTVYFLAEALALAASPSGELLAGIADGSVVGCLARCEGGATGAVASEVRSGRLYGRKLPVIDGCRATHALVTARNGYRISLYVVRLDQRGVARRPIRLIDRTRAAAEIEFDGAGAELLHEEGSATLQTLYDRAAVYLAFEQLGLAETCLEMARDYALERQAFGRPIGRYQAIKHKLADIYVAVEIARAHAYYGAWALSSGAPDLPLAAAAARIAATQASWLAAKENIQVHGGIGVTWEMDCHLYYRRAQLLGTVVGGADVWRQKLAAALVGN